MLLPRHRLLAEHPLAGTGRVYQNAVKKLRQSVRNACGRLIEHHRIGYAHALQIAFQDVRTGSDIFVAHQHAVPLQSRRKLAALAAGSRAQIQHAHPRLHAQQRRCRGRRRLLRVKHACMVVRMPPGLEVRLMHHECCPAKGRCFQRKVCFFGKPLRCRAQCRDRYAALCSLLRSCIQCVEPLSQKGALPLLKIFCRHSAILLWDV